MHTFRVWAPGRRVVELVVDGRALAMKPAGQGWWEISDDLSGPGTRYGYSLDGGEVRPDPRSASQPDGVLGLSEVVDQAVYSWSDKGWKGMSLDGVVIYELHTGTFSPQGTFDGIVDHLPHLVALGIDAIELMPVAEFSGDRGWGYDGVDLFAPHHAYGGPAGLKRLVDACHLAGLGVVMDVVYNHLGPVGNFLAEFGPYFSDYHHTAWGPGFNFDAPESDEVRRFVLDNALMWIRDYHIDGLRLDAANTIADETAPHILAQLTAEVEALGDDLHRATFVTAESDLNDPRFVRSRADGGYGFQAAWSDDWHHAMHATLTGECAGYYEDFGSMEILAKALRQAWAYDGEWSVHRQKIRGGSTVGLPAEAFVIAIQNHDQVGNRAAGDRLAALVDEGALKAAAALLLTAPFTPMLFQGEEWAASSPFQYFTDHSDPDLGRSVSEGRRQEFARFGWDPNVVPDPQDLRTFARSKLLWGELDAPFHRRMLEWYRELIRLRRRLGARGDLAGGVVRVQVDAVMRTVAFDRHRLSVRVNLGEKDWISEVSDGAQVLMASDPAIKQVRGCVRVRPSNVVILEGSIAVD